MDLSRRKIYAAGQKLMNVLEIPILLDRMVKSFQLLIKIQGEVKAQP